MNPQLEGKIFKELQNWYSWCYLSATYNDSSLLRLCPLARKAHYDKQNGNVLGAATTEGDQFSLPIDPMATHGNT